MKIETQVRKLNEASDRIGGYKGSLEFLSRFPGEVGRKVLKPAMVAADAVGVHALFASASQHGTGVLASTARAAEAVKKGVVLGKVGFFGKKGSHGWLVEYGHRIVVGGTVARINKARKDYGKVEPSKDPMLTGLGRDTGKRAPPHPILKPAYTQSRAQMEQVFAAEVIRRSDILARKLAKETGAT